MTGRTIRIWADTVSRSAARCRRRKCRAPIWFAQTVARGKLIPFDGPAQPTRRDVELGTGRPIWEIDEARVHFANCKGTPAVSRPAHVAARSRDWYD
jgi:hypothetical protein